MKGTASTHQGIAIKTKDDTEAALVKGRLFFTKAGQMQNAIDIALGKGSGKGKNAASSKTAKPLRDTIAKADTKSDLWMVVSVPDADRKNFSQNGLAVEFVTAGMNFTADVAISLKIGSDSPASAEKTVNLLNTLMPQVKTQLNTMGLSKAATSLAVAQDKAIVKATAVLTGAEIGTLTSLVGMMSSAGAGTPPPSTTRSGCSAVTMLAMPMPRNSAARTMARSIASSPHAAISLVVTASALPPVSRWRFGAHPSRMSRTPSAAIAGPLASASMQPRLPQPHSGPSAMIV
jgi:hypothetical protein